MGLNSIDNWSYNSSSQMVYLDCPASETPPLTLVEPAFSFFWALISSQFALFLLWTSYSSFLDKKRMKPLNTGNRNNYESQMFEKSEDMDGSLPIKYSEKNSDSQMSSTLDNDTKMENNRIRLQGSKKSLFGTLVLFNIHLNTLCLFVLMLMITLDYYGFITGTGAGLTHGDYDYSGTLFIIVWSYLTAWVVVLVVFRDKINEFFRLKTGFNDAQYIQVSQKRENIVFQKGTYGKLVEFVLGVEKKFDDVLRKNYHVTTCKVQINSSGDKYFEHNCSRYVYNPDCDLYESVVINIGDTNRSIINLRSGLTTEEAEKRLGLIGPNFISVKIPSFLKALFYEFMSFFYIYQFMMLWLFYYYNYWQVGLANTIVIFVSSIIKVYVKLKAEYRVKRLAEFEDSANIIRDGKCVSTNTKDIVVGDILVLESNKMAPCDLILISGNVTIDESSLTGEAMPVRKIPLKNNDNTYEKYSSDKISTILSGTTVLQSNPSDGDHSLALVSGTGTSSEKGKLINKILFPKEIQFVFNIQMRVVMTILAIQGIIWFGMILWLLKKNAVASWFSAMYALVEIISPILPAALVIGQTIAVQQLKKKNIFCVDVPRVVVAGKIQIFCFDKTGTLTNPGLDYHGISQVSSFSDEDKPISLNELTRDRSQYSRICTLGLASCHSVSDLDGRLIGNPVDIEMFKNTGWSLKPQPGEHNSLIVPPKDFLDSSRNPLGSLRIVREFEFQHHRQSMSVCVQEIDSGNVFAFVKGSFERISEIVDPSSIPPEYFKEAEKLAREGCYVLALAYKSLGKVDTSGFSNIERDDFEVDLKLACIIAFKNELKHDTKDALNEISLSNTRNVMITGDTSLTGINIARQCEMIKPGYSVVLGDIDNLTKSLYWVDVDTNQSLPIDKDFIKPSDKMELAVTGKAFTYLCNTGKIRDLLLHIRVFGRMTPQNKVVCVNLHMEKGITAMCGDGGNDCGALRAAHVGLALSNSEASIVSPFSSTNKSIYSCVELMSQGRGAIATSFANYKFLILYGQTMAMFKAFSMYYSVTISQPVWITVDAFISVGMTLSMSLSKPIKKLSKTRPTAQLLGAQTLTSALGQIIINWLYMIILFIVLYRQPWYRCHEFDSSSIDYKKWWLLGDNYESEILGMVIMIQFANCGLIYNFGYKFRQRWYRNYVLLIVYAAFISIFSYIMLSPPNRLGCLFRMNCGDPDVLVSLGYKRPNFYIEPYNIPQGHNVIPKHFRIFMWLYIASNVILGILWELLVVLGPVGTFIKRKYIEKKNNPKSQ
ncbi:putative cation-transporting ATPase 13A3 [Smittium mucronatum]|uniref:Putative cation-transporting ATPase 13A3 n=1 Tax=Smittium mucronatum TaxID=133383 RepID=A0A1R0GXJ7_9FUNG|nr:putative cation-transporting ATPase 13A3 [Smittium mucronatum]